MPKKQGLRAHSILQRIKQILRKFSFKKMETRRKGIYTKNNLNMKKKETDKHTPTSVLHDLNFF